MNNFSPLLQPALCWPHRWSGHVWPHCRSLRGYCGWWTPFARTATWWYSWGRILLLWDHSRTPPSSSSLLLSWRCKWRACCPRGIWTGRPRSRRLVPRMDRLANRLPVDILLSLYPLILFKLLGCSFKNYDKISSNFQFYWYKNVSIIICEDIFATTWICFIIFENTTRYQGRIIR